MKFIFATNNPHKLQEVREILTDFQVLSLSDVNIEADIPEDYDTLQENAMQKARFIYEMTGQNVFADDTGLEIEALNGRPGVYSARYAGENCSFADNVNKVLQELQGVSNRKAAFRTVVALILQGKEYLFEGSVEGLIIEKSIGKEGFGYDPLFVPQGYDETFAQMSANVKNTMSHRARAFVKVATFLKGQNM
jgi:XTP/dITP diphosphohydrolase